MSGDATPANRLLISSQRGPMSYMGQCKRTLAEHGELQLSALGVAISTLVTVAEILKTRDFAVEKNIKTLLETREDNEEGGRNRQKPKMEMVLTKSSKFDELMAAEAKDREAKAAAAAAAEANGDEA